MMQDIVRHQCNKCYKSVVVRTNPNRLRSMLRCPHCNQAALQEALPTFEEYEITRLLDEAYAESFTKEESSDAK